MQDNPYSGLNQSKPRAVWSSLEQQRRPQPPLLFRTPPTPEEGARLHLEEVWHDRRSGHYRLATDSGFALHVSGSGATVDAAHTAAYTLIDKLVLPHQFYRTDVGESFARSDAARLKEWGWLQ